MAVTSGGADTPPSRCLLLARTFFLLLAGWKERTVAEDMQYSNEEESRAIDQPTLTVKEQIAGCPKTLSARG